MLFLLVKMKPLTNQRKEKQGLLTPREEMITVGKPASILELLINGLIGFVFGYKLFGLFFDKPENINAQEYGHEMHIPVPSIEIQEEFCQCVAAVERLRTAHRAFLNEINALFAALQHRAFRGEL